MWLPENANSRREIEIGALLDDLFSGMHGFEEGHKGASDGHSNERDRTFCLDMAMALLSLLKECHKKDIKDEAGKMSILEVNDDGFEGCARPYLRSVLLPRIVDFAASLAEEMDIIKQLLEAMFGLIKALPNYSDAALQTKSDTEEAAHEKSFRAVEAQGA